MNHCFLPAHQLAQLIRDRQISTVEGKASPHSVANGAYTILFNLSVILLSSCQSLERSKACQLDYKLSGSASVRSSR